jgi:NAD(P)-dependent dehydrogenase (short-subunit alcohol dehydrogenase family)
MTATAPSFDLSGRVALVTGGSRGLGRAMTLGFAAAGADVVIASRDGAACEAFAAEVTEATGQRALGIGAHVGRWDALDGLVDRVYDEFGHLDVLVNNAGIVGAGKPVGEVTGSDMQTTYNTNVFGVVRVTHAFLPLLQASDAPVVVNVSSGLGSLAATGDPGRVEFHVALLDYNSSKTALVMVTSQYAKAYPAIRFNAVDPGYTATDLNGHQGTNSVEEGTEIIVRMAAIGADGPTGGFFDKAGPVVW